MTAESEGSGGPGRDGAAVAQAPDIGGRERREEVAVPDGAAVRVPVLLVSAAAWSWRILVVLGALAVLGLILQKLTLLVIPFATALLAAALLAPLAGWLRRHGLGRATSTLLTVVVAAGVLIGAVFFVIDQAVAGYGQLANETSRAVTNAQNYLTNGPFHLQKSSIDNLGTSINNLIHRHQGQIASGAVSAGRTALDVVTGAILFVFLTIFLVYDGDRVWDWVVRLLPRRSQDRARGAGHRAWRTLSGYIGGQFLVALFHTVAISVTLLILRAPLIAPLALVVFIFSFVPIIGAVVAGAFAVVVVLVADGPIPAVILIGVLVVEDQIEGHILQPLVVGRYVRLHPIAIAATLMAGAIVAGIPGAIFGVPLVAAVNAAAKYLGGREDIDGNAIVDADAAARPPPDAGP